MKNPIDEDNSHWQSSPPWTVFDPDTKAEFVTPETLRYYVAHTDDGWFICDRFTDLAVPGTHAKTRPDAIRAYYESVKRKVPKGWSLVSAVKGTQHSGIA
jgi:hypothetical protein